MFGCAIYWFYASGEIQPWAVVPKDDNIEFQKSNGNGKHNGHTNEGAEIHD